MSISRWAGRVAVVTGASAGIGAATALELCRNGIMTVALARRVEKTEALKENLSEAEQANFYPMKCDISNEADVIRVFTDIERIFGGIDILINNAGVISNASTIDPTNSTEMRRVIDTNVMGLIFCTREAVKSIKSRDVDGHVIHISSIAGHYMPYSKESPGYGIYFASKFAVTALTEQHRQEFMREKLKIKVSAISPGAVRTEIMQTSAMSISPAMVNEIWNEIPYLESKDIADAVIYLLGTPPNVQVCEMIMRPMNEEY